MAVLDEKGLGNMKLPQSAAANAIPPFPVGMADGHRDGSAATSPEHLAQG